MKTTSYNPSPIEVEFANVLTSLQGEIEKKLSGNKIIEVVNKINADNPMVIFYLQDKDGDKHELVVKMIQKPDAE